LARLGKLAYTREAYDSLIIPPAVRTETIERGRAEGYTDASLLENLESEGWLRTGNLSSQSRRLAHELAEVVGRGEAEALSLAIELKERLFMDDHKGRRIANFYRIRTTTTLGILLELLVNRTITISDYKRNVKIYSSQGWISAEVMQEYLERGERFE
jgi:predicted nucleic acid-binding protein